MSSATVDHTSWTLIYYPSLKTLKKMSFSSSVLLLCSIVTRASLHKNRVLLPRLCQTCPVLHSLSSLTEINRCLLVFNKLFSTRQTVSHILKQTLAALTLFPWYNSASNSFPGFSYSVFHSYEPSWKNILRLLVSLSVHIPLVRCSIPLEKLQCGTDSLGKSSSDHNNIHKLTSRTNGHLSYIHYVSITIFEYALTTCSVTLYLEWHMSCIRWVNKNKKENISSFIQISYFYIAEQDKLKY